MNKLLSNGVMVLILAAFILMFTTGVVKTYEEASKAAPRHGSMRAPVETCPYMNPAQTCPYLENRARYQPPQTERDIKDILNRTT